VAGAMNKTLSILAFAALSLTSSCAKAKSDVPPPTPENTAMSFHELSANALDGTKTDLSQYKGKVLLVVNTASECGYTPQYEGLEKLYEQYKDKGLVVLGFPSNDFGGQEPGSSAQIAEFCRSKYSIQFPMFEKVVTKGAGQSPVYRFLTAKHGEPKWNFTKYLVGKDGQVKGIFPSKVTPDSAELRSAIDAELAGGV
jgi:glutathione peroxidase